MTKPSTQPNHSAGYSKKNIKMLVASTVEVKQAANVIMSSHGQSHIIRDY
jgi:hypothetical protein